LSAISNAPSYGGKLQNITNGSLYIGKNYASPSIHMGLVLDIINCLAVPYGIKLGGTILKIRKNFGGDSNIINLDLK
jgi:hypothetical protein